MILEEIQHEPLLLQKETSNESILATLREASKKIAPVWPLENFVAVNPYLGLTHKTFTNAAQTLALAGGIKMTLPISFYLKKWNEGSITKEDLAKALQKYKTNTEPTHFITKITQGIDHKDIKLVPTIADVASEVTKKDWNRFSIGRISAWAATYFDKGQATWTTTNQNESIFSSWKADATVDFTPELSGLKGFRKIVKSMPNNPLEAAKVALDILEIPTDAIPIYLHRLLLQVGGWSSHAARLDWDSELYGGKDGNLIEFLSVLICWEACLYRSIVNSEVEMKWEKSRNQLEKISNTYNITPAFSDSLILQEAFDIANQRILIHNFLKKSAVNVKEEAQIKAQAIFCIDVRSEVFRRNLEKADPQFETLGFAGFFAFPIKYIPIGNETGEAQCPVLLKTGPTILESLPENENLQKAIKNRILKHQAKSVWKSFKSGAVTCFGFVSPMGISYLPKLFTDSFGWTRPVSSPEKSGLTNDMFAKKTIRLNVQNYHDQTSGIPLDQQVAMAKNALKAMSLTNNFGRWVLIVGHGSTSVNNPHATGLDCGACGGHTGEANAKVAAAVLNDKTVRLLLKDENIHIPENTIFLACLHDTTTDQVTIFNEDEVSYNRQDELDEIKKSLAKAGHASRAERALKISGTSKSNVDKFIKNRSNDWSQVRPEWGLAGCYSFVVAPRERTIGMDMKGQSFLHSYNWKEDHGFSVLELIMTAPMVVTSWINLQYYASTVDNKKLGSGNKTLHNITAGIGVLEGYSGDLRVGLPFQSVHNGDHFQHEPVRLNVVIEAPLDAMNNILEKHGSVRDLCDNEWIHLLAMNDAGKISHRYIGNLKWEEIQ